MSDLDGGALTKWLLQREAEGMSAATRNGYRETLVMFANWCCSGARPRLMANPLAEVPRANVKTDRRRHRRAMTEAELMRLLNVARWRPLAEYGRATAAAAADTQKDGGGQRCKRSNWSKAALTLDGLQAAVERARERIAKNPDLIEKLERLGRERALIFKTLVLTGLRKGELASLTVGQLNLDAPMPFVVLEAGDEKNRNGSTIPLRLDLANDLRDCCLMCPTPLRFAYATTTQMLPAIADCSAFPPGWCESSTVTCRPLASRRKTNAVGQSTSTLCEALSQRCYRRAGLLRELLKPQ